MYGVGTGLHASLFDRREVASELRGIKGLTGGAQQLVDRLATDLDQNAVARLERWAELDLVALFARAENLDQPTPPLAPAWSAPLPSSTRVERLRGLLWQAGTWLAAQRRRGWERFAESLLGVLVFVPLLITWSGLALAAHAYGRLASSNAQQATRPFLQLWESGFDGRLPSWARFGDVAVAAVLFISMLLLLSTLHSLARHRAQSEGEASEADREQWVGRLAVLFSRAQYVVGEYRSNAPTRLSEALSGSTGELAQLLTSAKQSHDTASTVLGRVGALTQALEDVTDRVIAAAEQIKQAQVEGMRSVDQTVQTSADRLQQAYQASTDGVRQATDKALASVQQTLEVLRDVQRDAADAVERDARESREVVREGVKALQSTQEAALDSLREARMAMAHSTSQGADAVETVGGALRGTGDRIDAALRTLSDSQEALSRRSAAAADAADRTALSMQDMAKGIAEAIRDLRLSVERWDAAAAHWVQAAATVERGTRSAYGAAPGPRAPREQWSAQPGPAASGPAPTWTDPQAAGQAPSGVERPS